MAEARTQEDFVDPRDKILTTWTDIIVEIVGIDPEKVTPNKTLVDDLDIDSLTQVEMVVRAEDEFMVKITDEHLGQLAAVKGGATVGHLGSLVLQLREEGGVQPQQ